MSMGGLVLVITGYNLRETHLNRSSSVSLRKLVFVLLKDTRVVGYGSLVGACLGIFFTYYAEGSFYLIDLLGLTFSLWIKLYWPCTCRSFRRVDFKKTHDHLSSSAILWRGILVLLFGATFS